MFGAVEGGGTKFLCALGESSGRVLARTEIPTTTPSETLARVIDFFAAQGIPHSVGVAMFGPLNLSRGTTLKTPKAAWNDVAVAATLEDALGVRVALDTDVNAAALAEWTDGAGQECDPLVYITVGTGVGGGLLVGGEPVHGLLHPEMGHLLVPRYVDSTGVADSWPGACPFHGACVEGVASGSAIQARTGKSAKQLDASAEAWAPVVDALAHLVVTTILVASPQRVVMGGGVMNTQGLRAQVATRAQDLLRGYVQAAALTEDFEHYLVAPRSADAGLRGAFALAMRCT